MFEVCLALAWGAFFKVFLVSLISAKRLSIASSSRDILLQVTGLMVLEKALEKDCTFPVHITWGGFDSRFDSRSYRYGQCVGWVWDAVLD